MADASLPGGPASILLVRLGGLGDLLAVVPSIRLLRRLFPGSRLTLAGREDYGPLLTATGLVDALEPAGSPRFAALYADAAAGSGGAGDWPGGFDLAVGWFQGGGTGTGDLEKAFTRRGVRALMLNRDRSEGLTMSRGCFEATLRALGAPPGGRAAFEDFLGLPLTDGIRSAGRDLAAASGLDPASRLIVIHPGAGSRAKRWPLERFLSIAAELGRDFGPGLIVTGEAEGEIAAQIGAGGLPRRWTHVAEPSLVGLAGLLSACALYIGNDSGVTHLAAASGAPVLAVFRSECEAAWRPEGRVTIVQAEEVGLIAEEDVLTAARNALELPVLSGELHK